MTVFCMYFISKILSQILEKKHEHIRREFANESSVNYLYFHK